MRSRMIITLCAVAIALGSITAKASVPTSISVQGKLTDASGVPLPAGAKTFTFRIFDAATLGTQIWPGGGGEVQSITSSTDGLWVGLVGAVSPLTEVVFADSTCWLEINVDGTTLPRVRLVTGPFAFRVATVDGASGGTITSKLSIGPGHSNTGEQGFIAGADNIARGAYSSVSGGKENISFSDSTHVGGGGGNVAAGLRATIGGGANNETDGDQSTVGGGRFNKSMGLSSTVSGGYTNIATATDATIGGGAFDSASGDASTVAGGSGNKATGPNNTIGGGGNNRTSAASTTVAGGFQNEATADDATVGGGYNNVASGYRSTVPGGTGNVADGANSFACGVNARAIHDRSFVWNDDPFNVLLSTAPNHFIIGTSGRIGIGTNEPEGYLHVFDGSAGSVTASINSIAVVERDSAGYLSILTPANMERGILFGEPGSIADGGIIYDPPINPGSLNFRSGGNTTRMTIDALGQVGIGAPIPETKLHVVDPAPAGSGYTTVARFENAGNSEVEIVSPTTEGKQLTLRSYDGTVRADFATGYNPADRDEIGFFIDGLLEMYLKKTVLGVNGDINAAGCVDGTNLTCPSDERLKKDIEPIEDALESIKRLRGVHYHWRDEFVERRGYSQSAQVGVIAQDVREVLPEAVIEKHDGYLSVDYTRLVPLLIEGMKEQQKRIEALEKKLERQTP